MISPAHNRFRKSTRGKRRERASDAAVRATTSADAETNQATAVAKRQEAADARANAVMHAGTVTAAKDAVVSHVIS